MLFRQQSRGDTYWSLFAQEEAAAEAAHNSWCNEELKNNKLKRDKKTSKVNLLTAQVEELTASIDTMAKTGHGRQPGGGFYIGIYRIV